LGVATARFTDGHVELVGFLISRDRTSGCWAIGMLEDGSPRSILQAMSKHHDALGVSPSHVRFVDPRSVAELWQPDGTVLRWKAPFDAVLADLQLTAEVAWPLGAS